MCQRVRASPLNREIFTQLSGKWGVSVDIFTGTLCIYRGMCEASRTVRILVTVLLHASLIISSPVEFQGGCFKFIFNGKWILKFKMTHAKPYAWKLFVDVRLRDSHILRNLSYFSEIRQAEFSSSRGLLLGCIFGVVVRLLQNVRSVKLDMSQVICTSRTMRWCRTTTLENEIRS